MMLVIHLKQLAKQSLNVMDVPRPGFPAVAVLSECLNDYPQPVLYMGCHSHIAQPMTSNLSTQSANTRM